MYRFLREGYPHYKSQYPERTWQHQFPDEDDHPNLIVAIARYPIMILAMIGLAYLFFTPVPHSGEQHAIAHYSCTINPHQDWCRELQEDRAHGRKEVQLRESLTMLFPQNQSTFQTCKESHNDPLSQKHR